MSQDTPRIDNFIKTAMQAKRIYHRIWIMLQQKSFVQWAISLFRIHEPYRANATVIAKRAIYAAYRVTKALHGPFTTVNGRR